MIGNRNVVKIVFFLIFNVVVIGLFFYRYIIIDKIIIYRTDSTCNRISKIYSNIILNGDEKFIENLKIKIGSNTDFADFIKNSLKFFNSLDVEKLTLYDNAYTKLLSSNNKTFNYSYKTGFSVDSLFSSFDRVIYTFLNKINIHPNNLSIWKTKSTIISPVTLNDELIGQVTKSIADTYCPLINEKDFSVSGFIEIITDITDELNNLNKLTFRSLILFISLFFILYIIMMLNNRNIQFVINTQIKTNRKLQEEKIVAEAESTAKTEFLANISHELRTPLNSIIGFSEIILNSPKRINEPQYISYINDINSSGKHLLDLINDILDFSKAAADRLKVESIDVDLNKICQSSMRFVKPRADQVGITLLENFPEDHLVIKADPKRLRQALLNLLSNSVKFTQSGGTVSMEIRLSDLHDKVMIIVKDTGIGIAQKDIPKALSVFQQIDNKLNRKYEGTGLGLPLTKKLVELMGGEFHISSEENVGTTVTLKFLY